MTLISTVNIPQIVPKKSQEAVEINFGASCFLPIELGRLIFTHARTNLDSMALVCKNWVALADEDQFLKILRGIYPDISGVKEWKERIKVIKICKEIPIPREVYRIIEEGGGLLTFIPEEVTVINNNGNEEVVRLNKLKTVGQLFKKPITDLETCFGELDSTIDERDTEPRKSHWVYLKTEVIAINVNRIGHVKAAKEEDLKAYGYSDQSAKEIGVCENRVKNLAWSNFTKKTQENPRQIIQISEPIDTAVSVLMAYQKSENTKRHYGWVNPEKNDVSVRVTGGLDAKTYWFHFAPEGLNIWPYYDIANQGMGIACARKSFGI